MGFHPNKLIPEEDINQLKNLIKKASSAADVKRVQCVYFRHLNYDIDQISQLTQFSRRHIQGIWTAYFKHGINALLAKPRGGRRNALLSQSEEEAVLAQHVKEASDGGILEIDALHQSLCEKAGKFVALSTAYRLAHRHGWRKIAPRPFHVKRDHTRADQFKIFSKLGGKSENNRYKNRKTPTGDVSR